MGLIKQTLVPGIPWQPQGRWWGAAMLLCLLCGCGEVAEERPPLHPAQGTLMINGQPAEGALLVLHPVESDPLDSRGTRPTARVDADGNFALTTYQDGDGAPAGDYHVAILWFDDPDSNNPWEKLGNRFADPRASKLQITVDPQQQQLDPIRLDGVRVVARRPAENPQDFDQLD